jgi:hypothetical protein
METVDFKQQELDFMEQQVLTDIFGGYTPDKFVYRFGFMKIDLEPKVQKIISDFEGFIKPLMEDDGTLDIGKIKKYINEQYIQLPDGRYRLIDVYRKCQPFLTYIVKYLKG